MEKKHVLAFDFGASSGRAMLAEYDGGKISMKELRRFSNDPVRISGTLYWDALRLFHEVKQGISDALSQTTIDAIGIDTWGVDFGLIDEGGRFLENPVHYRDERTVGMPDEVFRILSQKELYAQTGNQCMRLNTIYQLYYLKKYRPELLKRAKHLLLMPDLFAYFLTGEVRSEASVASTTNLFDPVKKNWALEITDRLGIDRSLFPPVIRSGERYGTLTQELCEELGCSPIPVVAVGTHDTASAVSAVPAEEKPFLYVSCGTWSLFGTQVKDPILTSAAAEANFTNEGTVDGEIRFLKNIMGLWLIQESRRQWNREGANVGYDTLEREALASPAFQSFIDVDDPLFETPGNLPKRVQQFCERTGQMVPQTRGGIMRCIYESLAYKYRLTLDSIRGLTGENYRSLHVVGGGIKDTLLCGMAADACALPVIAGPAEATVMGNIAVQYVSLDEISGFAEARRAVMRSVDLREYMPGEPQEWERHYPDYQAVIRRSRERSPQE